MLRTSLILAGLGFVDFAYAANCNTGDAPAPYDTYLCTVGGLETCQIDLTGAWNCGLSRGTLASTPATGTMVANYAGLTANKYSAWGALTVGTGFCCVISGDGIDELKLSGGGGMDTLSFAYGTTRNLQPSGASGITAIHANMYGASDDDTLYGSNDDSGNYTEFLDGGTGNDQIKGNKGNDVLNGGPDSDVLCDYEDDWLFGGDWDDILWLELDSLGYVDGGNDVLGDTCGYWDTVAPLWPQRSTCENALYAEPIECTTF